MSIEASSVLRARVSNRGPSIINTASSSLLAAGSLMETPM
jgi:hypothetical protein